MRKSLKNRTLMYENALVNQNLELDYLSFDIDYNAFSENEFPFTVRQYHIGHIDLVSFEAYSSPYYWWLIAGRNNIVDPFTEMYIGQKLIVPSLISFFDYFNKKVKPKQYTDYKFSTRTLS